MDAIYHHKGIIRPVVAVIKSLASALSIGSGGSVGREGPIIQTGASFGSSVGQVIPMSVWQRNTLIAAGAGGGIAATFNTPVGGILFALELMMVEISVRTLVPVTIATVAATYIGQLFFGAHPSFVIPALEKPYFQLASPWGLASYLGLGLGAGLVSALFIVSIYGFEDVFERRVPGNYYSRHVLGMFLVGVMMYVLDITAGHYYIEGVGYAGVQDVLTGSMATLPFLLLLLALKLLADVADPAFAMVSEDATLYDVLVEMHRKHATVSLITRGKQTSADRVVGVLTKWQIADALLESVELFSE